MVFTVFLSARAVAYATGEQTEVITTRNDFIKALSKANDGDTLLVGDIDFNLEGTGAVNVAERIIISKNITIKSGKTNNEQAVFTGASFDVKGTAVAGANNTVKFVGVTFDEKLNTSSLTNFDWELTYDSLNNPISPQPLKSQYAVQFFGNIDATFENCDFKNYMYTYGPAINAYYNSDGIEYADNKNCSLNLTLNGCNFTSNAALYGGGAIYLQANNQNIRFKAIGCTFYQNKSGFVEYASGGGAIYTYGTNVELVACDFNKNAANHYYGGEKSTSDSIYGGAVYCNGDNVSNGCTLVMRSCSVKENTASNGGGIAVVVMSNTIVDNCYIIHNTAKPACEDTRNVWGLSSNQGQGGGLYFDGTQGDVTIINTDITDNYAETIFPAICHETAGDAELLDIDIVLCTVANNVCGTQMSEYKYVDNPAWVWFTYPDDIYELGYINVVGCIVIDEDFYTNYPRYEKPTAENNYNYFATPSEAIADGYASADSHRSVVADQIVPKELYAPYYDEFEIVPFGDFHIGSNRNAKMKILLNTDEKQSPEQISYMYGVPVELPAPERKWHTFDGWFTDDEVQISTINFIFAHNIDTLSLTARYTDAFPYENIVGGTVTLNEDGTITITANVAPEGQIFSGWQINGEIVSNESSYTLDLDGNTVITAIYKPEGLSTGAIVCIVVGGFAVCAGIFFAVWHFVKKKKKLKATSQTVTVAEETAVEEKILPDTSRLTERENQVLELLLQGKKRAEMATALFVSEETIKKQITSIYGKLGVTSRSELFALFR